MPLHALLQRLMGIIGTTFPDNCIVFRKLSASNTCRIVTLRYFLINIRKKLLHFTACHVYKPTLSRPPRLITHFLSPSFVHNLSEFTGEEKFFILHKRSLLSDCPKHEPCTLFLLPSLPQLTRPQQQKFARRRMRLRPPVRYSDHQSRARHLHISHPAPLSKVNAPSSIYTANQLRENQLRALAQHCQAVVSPAPPLVHLKSDPVERGHDALIL